MATEEPVHRVGNPHASLRSRMAKAALEIIRVGRMQQQANFARLACAPAFCRGLPAEIPHAHAFDAEAPDMLGIVSALCPPIQNRVRVQKNTCWRDVVVVASGLTRRHPGAAKALPVRLGSRQHDPQLLDPRTRRSTTTRSCARLILRSLAATVDCARTSQSLSVSGVSTIRFGTSRTRASRTRAASASASKEDAAGVVTIGVFGGSACRVGALAHPAIVAKTAIATVIARM